MAPKPKLKKKKNKPSSLLGGGLGELCVKLVLGSSHGKDLQWGVTRQWSWHQVSSKAYGFSPHLEKVFTLDSEDRGGREEVYGFAMLSGALTQ